MYPLYLNQRGGGGRLYLTYYCLPPQDFQTFLRLWASQLWCKIKFSEFLKIKTILTQKDRSLSPRSSRRIYEHQTVILLTLLSKICSYFSQNLSAWSWTASNFAKNCQNTSMINCLELQNYRHHFLIHIQCNLLKQYFLQKLNYTYKDKKWCQ